MPGKLLLRKNASRAAEALLWTGGIFALSTVALEWGRASYAQWQASKEFVELQHTPLSAANLEGGALFGRITVPRLGLSALVFEGVGEMTLAIGVGHLPSDHNVNRNIVLAGHRDTFFRPLRGIRVGDTIEVSTPESSNLYTVTSTTVVEPTDTEVISPTSEPEVTLITCYPFSFLGPAPHRFVVRATRAGPK